MPAGYTLLTFNYDKERLQLIAKALKNYALAGKFIEQFEEDYGCTVILDDVGYGIKDVKFQNSSCETAFMLKYKT